MNVESAGSFVRPTSSLHRKNIHFQPSHYMIVRSEQIEKRNKRVWMNAQTSASEQRGGKQVWLGSMGSQSRSSIRCVLDHETTSASNASQPLLLVVVSYSNIPGC